MDAVTSTWAVIGKSIATATAGPIPGKTPTAVPSVQPIKHHNKLIGVAAVEKPCKSWVKISIAIFLLKPTCCGQTRQANGKQFCKHPIHRS